MKRFYFINRLLLMLSVPAFLVFIIVETTISFILLMFLQGVSYLVTGSIDTITDNEKVRKVVLYLNCWLDAEPNIFSDYVHLFSHDKE